MSAAGPLGRFLVNGHPSNCVAPNDRGVTVGDGLFETLRVRGGTIHAWERHMHRLARGCERLGFPDPPIETLARECAMLIGDEGSGSLRITLTRGPGPRGYAPPEQPDCTRVIGYFESAPGGPAANGLRLRWCRTRLAIQPLLAGIKHVARLEQVLARAEWRDPSIDEGIMLAADGRVIECTSANLFIVRDGALLTPRLDEAGVAGVTREIILEGAAEAGLEARVADLQPSDIMQAEEIFISNVTRGLAPVAEVDGTLFPAPGAATQRLLRVLGSRV